MKKIVCPRQATNQIKSIHPTEVLPTDTLWSSKERGWRGLIFEYTEQHPNELEVPPVTAH